MSRRPFSVRGGHAEENGCCHPFPSPTPTPFGSRRAFLYSAVRGLNIALATVAIPLAALMIGPSPAPQGQHRFGEGLGPAAGSGHQHRPRRRGPRAHLVHGS